MEIPVPIMKPPIKIILGVLLILRILTLNLPKPTYASLFNGFGTKAEENHLITKAICYFNISLYHNPHNPVAYYHLGRLYGQYNNPEKEIMYFTKAFEQGTMEPDALYKAGLYFIEQKSYTEAIECFERIIQRNIHSAEAYFQLGVIAETQGLYETALTYYQEAINAQYVHVQARYKLAMLSNRLGRRQEAKEQVIRLKRINQPELAHQLWLEINGH